MFASVRVSGRKPLQKAIQTLFFLSLNFFETHSDFTLSIRQLLDPANFAFKGDPVCSRMHRDRYPVTGNGIGTPDEFQSPFADIKRTGDSTPMIATIGSKELVFDWQGELKSGMPSLVRTRCHPFSSPGWASALS